MVQHMIDVHEKINHVLDSGNVTFKVTDCTHKKFTEWYEVLTLREQHFVFYLTRDYRECSKDKIMKFKVNVLFIGEQTMADRFRYTIVLSDPTNGQNLQFMGKPHSIRGGREEVYPLFEHENRLGFAFDENFVKRFTDDNQFILKLNITEEDTNNNQTENILISDKIITLDNDI